MLIRRTDQVLAKPMTMPGAEGVTMRLMVGRDDGAPTFAMRLFEVQPGGCTPFHQHPYEHEVMILEGAGELTRDGQPALPFQAGDVIFVQPDEMHQFRNGESSTMKFMCIVPTTHDCAGESLPTPGA